MNRVPEIVAHRGASAQAPENTLGAIKLAWELGADAVEVDLRLSRDGRIIVLHDESLRRTAAHNGKVSNLTLAEIRKHDAGIWKGARWKGERVPTLDEVLLEVPEGKRIYLEVKCGVEILQPLSVALAAASTIPAQITLMSFDRELTFSLKSLFPECTVLWLLKRAEDRFLAEAKAAGLDGVNCDGNHRSLVKAFVEAAHSSGLRVSAWTINQESTARRLRDIGLDALTTDHPDMIRRALS